MITAENDQHSMRNLKRKKTAANSNELNTKDHCNECMNIDVVKSTLNLLDNAGPDQLICLLTEVIHQLFDKSYFISIQRLDSSKLELIVNTLITCPMNHSINNQKYQNEQQHTCESKKSNNKMSNCVIVNLDGESESTENNVKSYVIKVNHINNAELRNLLFLEKGTIKKLNYDLNDSNLLTISKDLFKKIIKDTDYTNGVLMFTTNESNQLLCMASSDELFTGQMKIDIEKSVLETNLHSLKDLTIQEIEKPVLLNVLQKLLNSEQLEPLKSSQMKSFFMNLGSFTKENATTTRDNHHHHNDSTVHVYIVLVLWSMRATQSSNSENIVCIDLQQTKHNKIIDLLLFNVYKEKLLNSYKLQYFNDLKLFNNILHQEMIRFNCTINEKNLYEKVADILKQLVKCDW
ncbi:unnamed protein product [Schistosoma turkestanicum]|nr:unnamed protein product [Schistosoma turkestanicum]